MNYADSHADNPHAIVDVCSGQLLKNIVSTKMNYLSLMINTDGVSIKKSSNASFWPLQIICNFLPPHLRYRIENILCVAFYYNNTKPDMLVFFEPFCMEMQKLETQGFVLKNRCFKAIITHAIFDLPAKAAFQQTLQYNGYQSCGFCEHEGEKTDAGVRYTFSTEARNIRTHGSFIDAMDKIIENPNLKIQGIKGICPASTFSRFDMVKSFGIDYMHCVLLGVFKRLLEFWLCPSKKHKSYISKKNQVLLNRRVTSIKPCRFITRLPRSLDHRKIFKASEFRSLLLFYLPVCLLGFLEKKYLDHLNVLSSTIYKLLATNISNDDLITAEQSLFSFVKEYEQLYGKESMTMNVHLLTHLTYCIKNLGPLWSQSMFSFESNNGRLGRYVNGNVNILAQINSKYLLSQSMPMCSSYVKKTDNLEFAEIYKLNASELSLLSAKNISFGNNVLNLEIYCVYVRSDGRFTSISYTKAKKTIDYFVQLRNNVYGKVKFYFKYDGLNYMMIDQFECLDKKDQWREMKPNNVILVCLANEIEKNYIYINFLNKHYVTERPNTFESD